MSIIKLENVSKVIKKNTVLENINLEFEKERIYGLCGHNGCGKTMLLRMISGLIQPTEGRVMIDGKVLHKDIDFPESVGVMIENANYWQGYTGFEVLQTLASIKKIVNNEEMKKTLLRVGLNPDEKKTVDKYSLGMRQRLSIAQAIMEKPDIILLDEPTNALDKAGVRQMYDILEEERNRGAVIIIASHNEGDIMKCERLITMSGGRVECEEEIPSC